MPSLLESIERPDDLRYLTDDELSLLAFEIRRFLVDTCSHTGGHLAPSLGAVELILAAQRFLDCPHDKLFFDVGHQAYAHKLVTGRREVFETLRRFGGISGFTRRTESPYDAHDSGHASDSLSSALGYAYARDLRGGDETVVALIGDGSIGGGLAFEAMNHMGQKKTPLIILLNDNTMSISKNVGGLSLQLARARTNPVYRDATQRITQRLSNEGPLSQLVLDTALRARASVKQLVVPGMLFEEMGIKYIGPIDGHDIHAVTEALDAARNAHEPILIHAVTRKGKGYLPAEEQPDVFHGVGPFDRTTGEMYHEPGLAPSYTSVFSRSLIEEAERDERIVAITAAMPAGTGLDRFQERFPRRFFDVGIAEEHAVTLASGLALGGRRPVVAIYSTFLQRAFDEVIINVALQNVPVVFCIDRAGIVGQDGATHTGAFDIAYLRMIPNMTVMAPSDEMELKSALHTALSEEGPVAIRYPRGSGEGVDFSGQASIWERGRSVEVRAGDDVALLAVGRMVGVARRAAELLDADGISARVVDMRYVKPLDEDAILDAARTCGRIVTLEEGVVAGGFGSSVLESLSSHGCLAMTLQIGLPDAFIPHGSSSEVRESLGLAPAQVAARIKGFISSRPDGPDTIPAA